MTVLVVAPHPDDETLGCGGTIRKRVNEGKRVELCVVTRGYTPDHTEAELEQKREELERAAEILGIGRTHFLGHPWAKLDEVKQKQLNEDFMNLVDEVDPNILYVPFKGDLHKDHRLIFEAILVAARPHRCNVDKILAYETLSETEWGRPISEFSPEIYVDISDTLETKLEALSAYDLELHDYPHPRSLEAIEACAKKRGSEACLEAAEGFELIREVIR